MKGRKRRDQARAPIAPALRAKRNPALPCLQEDWLQYANQLSDARYAQRSITRKDCEIPGIRRCIQKGLEGRLRIGHRHNEPLRFALWCPASPSWGSQVNESTSAKRVPRRYVANDEGIWHASRNGPVQHELNRSALIALVFEPDDVSPYLRRTMVQPNRKPLAQELSLGPQDSKLCIDSIRRRVKLGIEQHVTASYRLLRKSLAH